MGIISQENIDTCKAKVKFSYDKEKISSIADEIAKEIGKNYKISGFRPGKAPIVAIKNVAKKAIFENAERQLIASAFEDILFENKWKPFGEPDVTARSLDYSKFEVEMIIGYSPAIELAKYKEFQLTEPDNVPMKDAITKRFIDDICMQFATKKSFSENDFILENDEVIINYSATIDGKDFQNNKADGIQITIGSNDSLPGFSDNMIGMKIGEKRQFKLHIPADWNNQEIANKDLDFDVELISGARKIPANFDESILEKIKGKDVTFDSVKSQIEARADEFISNARFNLIKGDICAKLTDSNEFDIPEWMIFAEAQKVAKVQGFTLEALNDELQKQLLDNSKTRIKLSFIIDKIKELEPEIVLTNDEAMAILNANLSKLPPNAIKQLNEGKDLALLMRLLNEIQIEWILKWILEHSTVSPKETKQEETKE
jgi:trigger factor